MSLYPVLLTRRRRGGGVTLSEQIIDLFGASSIVFIRILDDVLGTTSPSDTGPNALAATATDVTFNGEYADFNGTSSRINIYSAEYNTAMDAKELSAFVTIRLPAAAWTDGELRIVLEIRADASNAAHIGKDTANNMLQLAYIAGGTTRTFNIASSSEDWINVGYTASDTADEYCAYIDGVPDVNNPTDCGTWVGALDADTNVIGSYNTTPILAFVGQAKNIVVLNRVATPAEVASYNALIS